MSRIVVAMGGHALLPSDGRGDADTSLGNMRRAADAIAELAGHSVVVTHGSGPQIGRLATQSETAGFAEPLDLLGAETEGGMGYLLEREIRSRIPDIPVVTLLTQVEVDPEDPAFQTPTKPIGPAYDGATAHRLAAQKGWSLAPHGAGWRRVVASPLPLRILELEAIQLLLAAGHLVVCGGGGGIPVTVREDGRVQGIEAVIDKDRSSALLATGVGADMLLLLTDVPAVFEDWPERNRPLSKVSPSDLRAMGLPPGSMGPKAAAAADFVEAGGTTAVIGAIEDAAAMVAGRAGTRVESRFGPSDAQGGEA